MAEFYIGQIIFTSFNFAPRGFLLCDGSTLNIQQYAALHSLIRTLYGGDGKTTFKLPDLRGRTVLSMGRSTANGSLYLPGQAGGAEGVVLTAAQLPAHRHDINVSSAAGTVGVARGIPSSTGGPSKTNMYADPTANSTVTLGSATVSTTGANAAHSNMQPFLVINAAICAVGLYPPRD